MKSGLFLWELGLANDTAKSITRCLVVARERERNQMLEPKGAANLGGSGGQGVIIS